MRILIVSWYFPPVNTIGAIRVGKFARFLLARGHEIGVVAGKNWREPTTMPFGAPLERVVYAKSIDINALSLRPWHRGAGEAGAIPAGTGEAAAAGSARTLRRRLGQFYTNLTNLPDRRIGWLPWAYRGAVALGRGWRPDLIFASGPPFTAFLAAAAASRRLGRPWIAELRDRWADDPYEDLPGWRHRLDQRLERRVLRSASGLVTVSEPWAEFYRRKYAKPLATALNGYDPADFAWDEPAPTSAPGEPLVIGYTGGIYPGKRDPTPVFAAIRSLGSDAQRIRVIFHGADPAQVQPLAERAGVAALVETRPPVPYRQSLEFQRRCDVLLLMQWNDPREQGSCPGKLFEYIASLRPLLVLGLADGVPATITRQHAAGFCSNDATEIAGQLRLWLAERDRMGRLAPLPASARDGLSRTIQFERLEKFLQETLARAAPA